jgi:dihydroorotate dehydrogenase electron transfer subunit
MIDLDVARSGTTSVPLPRAARVQQVIQENARVKTLVLEDRVQATPGQFVMVWLPGIDEKPFSLACDNPLTLVVAQVGPFTAALHRLRAGDQLWWRGPFGHGFRLPPAQPSQTASGRLLLVAGGYGVAPLAFLSRRAQALGWPTTVVLGARAREDVLLQGLLMSLGCEMVLCTEDGSAGQQGLVTDAVQRLLTQPELLPSDGADAASICSVYGCGPKPMLEALRQVCVRHRLPCQLSFEALMKCALGVCGSCAHEGWLVCRDGPVFAWSPEGELPSAGLQTSP